MKKEFNCVNKKNFFEQLKCKYIFVKLVIMVPGDHKTNAFAYI